MINAQFLIDVSKIFDYVGYELKSASFDIDDFVKAGYKAFKNSGSIKEAKIISTSIGFILKHQAKVTGDIEKYYDVISSYPHNVKTYRAKEDEAYITITNYFTRDENVLLCFPNFLDNEYLEIVKKGNFYKMNDDDSQYHLKHLFTSRDSMVLLDKDDKAWWIMIRDIWGNIKFKNNRTNLSYIETDNGVCIYDANYLKSIGKHPNKEEMVAFIEFSTYKLTHNACIFRLHLFKTDIRLELLLLFIQSWVRLLYRNRYGFTEYKDMYIDDSESSEGKQILDLLRNLGKEEE